MPVDINNEISLIRKVPQFGSFLERALSRLQDGVNFLGTTLGADPVGTSPVLPPIESVNVSNPGTGLVHVTLTHNAPTQKALDYWLEWSTNQSFQGAYQEHLGASRQKMLYLPNGSYYIRAYHQLPGGRPSAPVNYGGSVPTAVSITTSSSLTLLPSTGSGTSSPSGQQAGQGRGVSLFRTAQGPKRNL